MCRTTPLKYKIIRVKRNIIEENVQIYIAGLCLRYASFMALYLKAVASEVF